MTRTRSSRGPLQGRPGEGPLPSQSTIGCYLSWHVIFFWRPSPLPLTVNAFARTGPPLLSSSAQRVKATCHPYLALLWYLRQPPLSIGADTSSRCQLRARYQQQRPSGSSLPLAPPFLSSWPVPRALLHGKHASWARTRQPTGQDHHDRAFHFQDVTGAVVVPAIREPTLNTPPPTHTRAKEYARLHARPRLPVGPRIAIPACGLPTAPGGDLRTSSLLRCCPPFLTDRWSLTGLGSSCAGLRMAARLFRLGRIVCTPPRRAAANCDTCALGNSLSSMAPLRLLRCGPVGRCWHHDGPGDLGSRLWEGLG